MLVCGLLLSRAFGDDSRDAEKTPTAIALVTALPSAETPVGTGASPTPPAQESPDAAAEAMTPTQNPNDQWGLVINSIIEDKSAVMFRSNISRNGVYRGDAITKQ